MGSAAEFERYCARDAQFTESWWRWHTREGGSGMILSDTKVGVLKGQDASRMHFVVLEGPDGKVSRFRASGVSVHPIFRYVYDASGKVALDSVLEGSVVRLENAVAVDEGEAWPEGFQV